MTGKRKKIGSSVSEKRSGKSMREQLVDLTNADFVKVFGDDNSPDCVNNPDFQGNGTKVSNRITRARTKKERQSWYKEDAEEQSSTPRFRKDTAHQSADQKEHHQMAANDTTKKVEFPKTEAELADLMKKVKEEGFNQGVEQGQARAEQEYAEKATEHAEDAVKGVWAKTKALWKANTGKIGTAIGVAAGVGGTMAYQTFRTRDDNTVRLGDTTVSWNTAGGDQGQGGGNPGGQGGGGAGGRGR